MAEKGKKDGRSESQKEGKKTEPKRATGSQEKSGKATKVKGEGTRGSAAAVAVAPVKRTAPPRMLVRYRDQAIPSLMEEFGYKNRMQVPRLSKIVLNVGLGEAMQTPKLLDSALVELSAITGQRPVVTRARKSIANFKLRQGVKIGAMVTLRRERMWEFFDRLVALALPRVRDFKGVSPRSFDGRGGYTLGLREQTIFPEIDYDKMEKVKGMNITVVTTAKSDNEARSLLRHLGLPFRS